MAVDQHILLITPPFTQLNTPYPATAYLKGFLNTKGISSFQVDLGLEVILSLFHKETLLPLFQEIEEKKLAQTPSQLRILDLKQDYIRLIDPVISFLQGKQPTFALAITEDGVLPQGPRFAQLQDLQLSFGTTGVYDKAKYLATLFLEDLGDFIKETIAPYFGFSRYAEKLARSAYSFDDLYHALQEPPGFIEQLMLKRLREILVQQNPTLVAITAPFPGNVFMAFVAGNFIKTNYPTIPVIFGGGFVNTELRSLQDYRVFEFVDFITLDDGEVPIEHIIEHLDGKRPLPLLKRTFTAQGEEVIYNNGSLQRDYKQTEIGTPDYTDLKLDQYISVLEVLNPMTRLWSDGCWNKLTMAHGCYWGKCTFCDITLDYIKNYEPIQASMLVDRMETIMKQTGSNGFHFVDEAAPPGLMKELAIEILKRKLVVTWWTNIRFEKSFTYDVCALLKASGCLGVSGGLEVASNRLLKLIDKGITIEQVSKVLQNFHRNQIMVHAYLMYGYPTQTVQETVDSLEVVRQLFAHEILKSAFWHQFALTVHSPIGKQPELYGIRIDPEAQGKFANNDLRYEEKKGIAHGEFSYGLKKSLFNYLHGVGLDKPLSYWFDFSIPKTSLPDSYIQLYLEAGADVASKDHSKIIWLGSLPHRSEVIKKKKGHAWSLASIQIETLKESISFTITPGQGIWLENMLTKAHLTNDIPLTYAEIKKSYEEMNEEEEFELFWFNRVLKNLSGKGLLVI